MAGADVTRGKRQVAGDNGDVASVGPDYEAVLNALGDAGIVGPDYEAVLNALGEAGIVTTPEGVVIAWNLAAEALYGWSAQEVVGRNIGEVTVPRWDADAAGAIMDQLRQGEAWSGEFPVRRKDDSTFIAHVTDSPVFDESGALVAIVGVSHDVTERRWR